MGSSVSGLCFFIEGLGHHSSTAWVNRLLSRSDLPLPISSLVDYDLPFTRQWTIPSGTYSGLGRPCVLYKVHSLRETNLFLVFNRCLWSGLCLHIWFHYFLLFPSISHTACLSFLEYPKHAPAIGPLHLHFLLPGMLFPWSAWFSLNVTSLRGLLGTNLQ